jgi:hypothetical protein
VTKATAGPAVAHAATAMAPLLRLIVSTARNAGLLGEATATTDHERLVVQIEADLRQATSLFDHLDSSLQSAWRLFEGLLEHVEKTSSGRLVLTPSRRPGVRSRKALVLLGLAGGEKAPSHLLAEGVDLWRSGFSVRTANRLAQFGFRSLVEVVVFHSSLPRLAGMGPATLEEIRRVLEEIEAVPVPPPGPRITLQRRPGRRDRVTIDWPAVGRQIQDSLESMGGSGTITSLLKHTCGLSHSRIKRGLALLEKSGVVSRSGASRSTCYHLNPVPR